MLSDDEKEKIARIEKTQALCITRLLEVEERATKAANSVNASLKSSNHLMASISADVQYIQQQSDIMRDRIHKIGERVMELVRLDEQLNIDYMRKVTSQEIARYAQDVEAHSNKKKTALQEMKKSFGNI